MQGRYEIRLNSGITISLVCLFQYRTYSGLLEGLPTRELNKTLIQQAISYATEKLWMGGTPHLIPPTETALGIPRHDWFDQDDEPAEIPGVACLATFQSMSSARDLDADCSSLRVVWFQGNFGPPAEPDVLSKIRALDWPALATDGYW
jgi:hypothetical protein